MTRMTKAQALRLKHFTGLKSPACIYPNPTKRTVTGAHDRLHSTVQRVTNKEDKNAQA